MLFCEILGYLYFLTVPAPQSWQLDCPAAACFFPAGHTRQLSLDELAEVYFPLWQAMQSETEVPGARSEGVRRPRL